MYGKYALENDMRRSGENIDLDEDGRSPHPKNIIGGNDRASSSLAIT